MLIPVTKLTPSHTFMSIDNSQSWCHGGDIFSMSFHMQGRALLQELAELEVLLERQAKEKADREKVAAVHQVVVPKPAAICLILRFAIVLNLLRA